MTLQTGERFTSNNYGDFTVVRYESYNRVTVEFLVTGTSLVTSVQRINLGYVKDKFVPNVFGVGYIGNGKSSPNKIDRKAYQTWAGMLERCYCPKAQKRYPTYNGCVVCDEWHDFGIFQDWFNRNYKEGLDIDKDILAEGRRGKLYSPKTCKFVTKEENASEACAKRYFFTSPTGGRINIYNLRQFCLKHGLHPSHMTATHNGKLKQHKGWTKA